MQPYGHHQATMLPMQVLTYIYTISNAFQTRGRHSSLNLRRMFKSNMQPADLPYSDIAAVSVYTGVGNTAVSVDVGISRLCIAARCC